MTITTTRQPLTSYPVPAPPHLLPTVIPVRGHLMRVHPRATHCPCGELAEPVTITRDGQDHEVSAGICAVHRVDWLVAEARAAVKEDAPQVVALDDMVRVTMTPAAWKRVAVVLGLD